MKYVNFLIYRLLFLLTFVGIVFNEIVFVTIAFIGTVFVASMVLSHVITESSIILSKYLPFLQMHPLGFEI